jgi:hypothetical protein
VNKITKLGYRLAVGAASLAGLAVANLSMAADPFNLQGKIDTLASTTGSYFDIMITSFWPLLLGALILGVIVAVVVGLIVGFFRHRGK